MPEKQEGTPLSKKEKTIIQDPLSYPAGEDIYNRSEKEDNIDPDELTEKPLPVMLPANDLDVPGSELDDEQENIGSEDEENNYYSLGGDDHNDLDEAKEE
jgi:hypothetical protein